MNELAKQLDLAKQLSIIDEPYKDQDGKYYLHTPLRETPPFLLELRKEAIKPPDPRYRFTLETAERILNLADQNLVDDKLTLTMAAQAVREAAMTGLEKYRWDTIAFNMKTQQWEKWEQGDWSEYIPQYKATKQV